MKKRETHKLSPKLRRVVLEALALGESTSEILERLFSEFGVEISDRAVRYYKSRHIQAIRELRVELNDRLQESFPFANLSVRVHAWSKIIETGTVDQRLKALRDLSSALESSEMHKLDHPTIIVANSIPGLGTRKGIKEAVNTPQVQEQVFAAGK